MLYACFVDLPVNKAASRDLRWVHSFNQRLLICFNRSSDWGDGGGRGEQFLILIISKKNLPGNQILIKNISVGDAHYNECHRV